MTMFEQMARTKKRLPEPSGWRILVRIPEVVEKTTGGILLPDAMRDSEKILTMFAVVQDSGPVAYLRPDLLAADAWCEPGDTVLISKYAGTRIAIEGEEFRV